VAGRCVSGTCVSGRGVSARGKSIGVSGKSGGVLLKPGSTHSGPASPDQQGPGRRSEQTTRRDNRNRPSDPVIEAGVPNGTNEPSEPGPATASESHRVTPGTACQPCGQHQRNSAHAFRARPQNGSFFLASLSRSASISRSRLRIVS
jgi:hypothetical protein